MALSKQTSDLLIKFAKSAIEEPDEAADETAWPLRGGRYGPDENGRRLNMTGDDWRLYQDCVELLAQEPELEHITRKDIDENLWELNRDLVWNRTQYQDGANRQRRVREFLSIIVKPWTKFEVMFLVEGLNLTQGRIRIGQVEMFSLSEHEAREWGIDGQLPSFRLSELVGRTVALVSVSAGSPGRAFERAKSTFEQALNIFRVCVASSPSARIWDEQLLQNRGQISVVKALEPEPMILPRFHRGFERLELTLDGPVLSATREMAARLKPLLDGTVQGRLGAQFVRALEWIGSSISREHHDDKVVDLCTALESLLTMKSDPRKGEAISLRYMLLAMELDKPFFSPVRILELYELRSQVVHGSSRGVCGESQYRWLWRTCLEALIYALELTEKNSSITRPSLLIQAIETEALLQRALTVLSQFSNAEALESYANCRLSHLVASGKGN